MYIKLLTFLVCVIAFVSCGDDSCTQADWVGTYTLQSEDCSNPDVTFDNQFIIEAGTTSDELQIGGQSFNFTDCNATFLVLNMELNGDEFSASVGDCSAVYKK